MGVRGSTVAAGHHLLSLLPLGQAAEALAAAGAAVDRGLLENLDSLRSGAAQRMA
jgi:hypothetical protein